MRPRLLALAADGALSLPLPGGGRTLDRWDALSSFCAEDVVLGRLVEAHTDADAILAELEGSRAEGAELWGVWAAEPPEPVVRADRHDGAWFLTGRKLWCSGASLCTHALVTARAGDARGLFAVELGGARAAAVPGTWHAVGMARSDSGAVDFHDAPARLVGEFGQYLDRPGFWHGAIGVAACWYGGARAIADTLRERRPADPHALAHLGAVDAALSAARWSLEAAARAVDADPLDVDNAAKVRALRVRSIVENTAAAVIDRVGRALGAGPLCADAQHAARVADLTVYLRQSHAERDLQSLGEALGKEA